MDPRVVASIRRGQAQMQDRMLADLLVERGVLSRAETAALTADTPPGSLADRLLAEDKVSSGQLEALSQEMDLLESLDTVVADVTPGEVREAAREAASRVGKYVLVGKLGVGGMGEVWRAWDYGLGRWVALKFLKVQDQRLVRRFLREATLLARLAHPNVTQVFEVGIHEGRPFLAMELVDGGALDGEALTRREAAKVVRAAALGVGHAHSQGIVHRDLKPSNLLRSLSGRIFVTDFGLARMRAEEGGLTVSGALLGTPSFMAPEQAQGMDADERTDVYGLGATLYALVEGRPPFEGEAAAEIVRRAATAPPPSLSGARDDLTVVTSKAMERDRRDRYQTAQELVEDLDRYLADEPVAAQPISTVSRVWRKVRRRPVYSGGVAAATALVVVLGSWAGARISESRQGERADRILGEIAPLETEFRRYVDNANADAEEAVSLREAMRPAIERAVATAPGHPRSLLYQGRLLNWSGDYRAAEDVFKRLLERRPGFHEARVARAKNRLLLAGETGWEPDPTVTTWVEGLAYEYEPPPPEAVTWIDAAAEDFTALPETHEERAAGLGIVAFYRGDYQRCAERLDAVVAERPYLNEARRGLLWCLLGVNRFEEAERHAVHFIERGIFTQNATEMRAFAQAGQREFAAAIETLRWLRQNQPGYEPVFIPFWLTLDGRFEEALADYDRMLAENPDSVRLLLDRSMLHLRMDRREEALADAGRAVELAPDDPQTHYQRAAVLAPDPRALDSYATAIELDPENPLYRGQRGMLYLGQSHFDAALADLDFALEREPDQPYWNWAAGIAHFANEAWAPAERHLDRAAELGLDGGDTLYYRGVARVEQGECVAGIDDLVATEELEVEIAADTWEWVVGTCGTEPIEARRRRARTGAQ